MKIVSGSAAKGFVIGLLSVALLFVTGAWAKPTTPEQAKTVVLNWLAMDPHPLGASLGQQIKQVQTFSDDSGKPLYYVVYLNPTGYVLVSGEDLVEPIIAFLPTGTFDPSPDNPLGALVSQDVPGRVQAARQVEAQAQLMGAPLGVQTPEATAQKKWSMLENSSALMGAAGSGIASVSDLRVAPFILTHWSQTTVDDTLTGLACYNYYTFPNGPGAPSNYPSGCVATAMGQLMRYWQYPQARVGIGWFYVTIDGALVEEPTRGGDGNGGPYDWADMILNPISGASDTQRQAIGNLLRDAGVSVNMKYTATSSGAFLEDAATSLAAIFGYSNAIIGDAYSPVDGSPASIPYVNRNNMINPNLQAKYPVILGIYQNSSNGHAVVCDGYGYDTQTMYHHLNMGWSGQDDAWYNLPLIYTSSGINFNVISSIVYNVYASGKGEIIAGRVTDPDGNPVTGATVTATGGYTATTDAHGLYALVKVPSSTTFTINVSKTGYTFCPQTVTTGKSISGTTNTPSYFCGNLWGVDFVSRNSPFNQALDNYFLNFSTKGNASWFAETDTWYYGGSAAQSGAIDNGQSSTLQTTVSGPGVLSFYWSSSSTAYYNRLVFTLDSTPVDMISGLWPWTQKTLTIPAGPHTIAWTYSKTANPWGVLGQDCAWVDKVVYVSGSGKQSLGTVYQLLLMP